MLKVVYQAEVDNGAVLGQTVSYADFSSQPDRMAHISEQVGRSRSVG